jgi:hypothetical protein
MSEGRDLSRLERTLSTLSEDLFARSDWTVIKSADADLELNR